MPLIISVDQGTKAVTVSVDLSEAGEAIAEEPNGDQGPDTDTDVPLPTSTEQDQDVTLIEELYNGKVPASFTMEWQ